MTRRKHCARLVVATGIVAVFSLATSEAAVIVNAFTNVAPDGGAPGATHDPSVAGTGDNFSASGSDLLEGLTGVYSGNTNAGALTADFPSPMGEVSTGLSAFTDGEIIGRYAGDVDGDGVVGNDLEDFAVIHDGYGTASNGGFLTFDLGGVFEITQVDVFLGWNDSGRDDSSFNLLSSVDGASFSLITSFDHGPDNTGAIGSPVTNLRSVVDDGGAPIASLAQFLQIEFTAPDNAYVGVLEVDAFGTLIPEPSSACLFAIAAAGCPLARRTRRSR